MAVEFSVLRAAHALLRAGSCRGRRCWDFVLVLLCVLHLLFGGVSFNSRHSDNSFSYYVHHFTVLFFGCRTCLRDHSGVPLPLLCLPMVAVAGIRVAYLPAFILFPCFTRWNSYLLLPLATPVPSLQGETRAWTGRHFFAVTEHILSIPQASMMAVVCI
jgi:hypothetical protein